LSSAFNSEALTARTTHVINGSAPYLTFDGGITKVTDTEGLLGITIPGIGNITPNDPRAAGIIEMVNDNVSFNNIGMLVPPNAPNNTISLSTLIDPSYNYWRDDDGDGQGIGGITATGQLKLTITDKYSNPVSRGETLTTCKSPYTLKLQSTGGTLSISYGVPRTSTFNNRAATYRLKSKDVPTICFARPIRKHGSNDPGDSWFGHNFRGPSNIWNPAQGFFVQSTDRAHYDENFPTTGANKLGFFLIIAGVNAADLTWNSPTHQDITASVALISNAPYVTLAGPDKNTAATKQKLTSPETFELIASKNGTEVFRYGFVLKQWFVNRGSSLASASDQAAWCSRIGYSLPHVKDLTNAICRGSDSEHCSGSVGATPSSSGNNYMRYPGAGFFSEWGRMQEYDLADFAFDTWTSDVLGSGQFYVTSRWGNVILHHTPSTKGHAVCASVLRP
jgi:hypothetical protein